MEDLEVLRRWLQGFPLWTDAPLHIDYLQPQPENLGLYPLGEEILERREDLLGCVTVRCRRQFALHRMVCPGDAPAQWLLEFQQWVTEQSALGLAPQLGEDCILRAEHGRIGQVHQSGTAVYSVTITAEFTRKY